MLIELVNVKKSYEGRTVVNLKELIIKGRKITSIFGPNGSGKTTLLKILAGIEQEYSGQITYDKFMLNDTIRKKVTMVFQNNNLLNKTVYDNIEFPLRLRKIKKSESSIKVQEALSQLDIHDISSRNAGILSSGEIQKVSLARALVFEPSVLILDEPTTNMDDTSTKNVQNLLAKLNQEKKTTIIMVTHDLEQAQKISHEILYFKDGMVVGKDEVF